MWNEPTEPTKSQRQTEHAVLSHSSENNVPMSASVQVQVCMAAQSNYIQCLSVYLRFCLCVLKDTAKTSLTDRLEQRSPLVCWLAHGT